MNELGPGTSQQTIKQTDRRILFRCIRSIFICNPISIPSPADTKKVEKYNRCHCLHDNKKRPEHSLDHRVPSSAAPSAASASAAAGGGDASSSMDVDGAVGDPSSGFFPLGFPRGSGTSGQLADSRRPVVSETAPKSATVATQTRVSA